MRFRVLAAVPFIAISLLGCSSSGDAGNSSATVPANATVVTAIDGIAWDAKSYDATLVGGEVTIVAKNDSTFT